MFFRGASLSTFPDAAKINGVFEPTQENGLDGRVLYTKRGDTRVIIEHHGGFWRITHAKFKGKNNTYAHVPGGAALEACRTLVWDVWDGNEYVAAPGFNMCREAEVSRCAQPQSISCGDAHPLASSIKFYLLRRTPPPLATSSAPAARARITHSRKRSSGSQYRAPCSRGVATACSVRSCCAAAAPCLAWPVALRAPSTDTTAAAALSVGSCITSQSDASAYVHGGFGSRYLCSDSGFIKICQLNSK